MLNFKNVIRENRAHVVLIVQEKNIKKIDTGTIFIKDQNNQNCLISKMVPISSFPENLRSDESNFHISNATESE